LHIPFSLYLFFFSFSFILSLTIHYDKFSFLNVTVRRYSVLTKAVYSTMKKATGFWSAHIVVTLFYIPGV